MVPGSLDLVGTTGARGDSGLSGDPGPCGQPQISGLQWLTGAIGPQGIPGLRGEPDPPGTTGAGLPGVHFNGNTQVAGLQGPEVGGDLLSDGREEQPQYRNAELSATTTPVFTTILNTPFLPSGTLHNSQKAYNPATGIFTCPFPSLYYFSYHVHVKGTSLWVALFHNNVLAIYTYDEYKKGYMDQASGSVVLELQENDQLAEDDAV
ncbi:hypothetical protein AAFF_G00431280 [Aldrovandia affinis]|uniref:C1q domain-containing protein n=1 Tax=Aldrovandia affinis TaxID=143900 RepID=A0AAD7WIA2_9TELE|nr:hypothetical protein AAFF_G00431280 [Aldrovandia affinis]